MIQPHESIVMGYCAAGLNDAEIAREMGVDPHTVRDYMVKVRRKLGARDRLQAALIWRGVDLQQALADARKHTRGAVVKEKKAVDTDLDLLRARVAYLEDALCPAIEMPREWRLTASQCIIMSVLAKREIATRNAIMAALYGHDPDGGSPKSIDVQIYQMRKKLARFGVEIKTYRYVGYSLNSEARAMVRVR